MPRTSPPLFQEWADEFLAKVAHPNTHRRYSSSVEKLEGKFTGIRLNEISPEQIELYEESRLAEGVEPATVNHDLRVLRRMLRLAQRKDFISQNPFTRIEFLKQRSRRQPHIITFEEEEKILGNAVPYLRVLVVLILETETCSGSTPPESWSTYEMQWCASINYEPGRLCRACSQDLTISMESPERALVW